MIIAGVLALAGGANDGESTIMLGICRLPTGVENEGDSTSILGIWDPPGMLKVLGEVIGVPSAGVGPSLGDDLACSLTGVPSGEGNGDMTLMGSFPAAGFRSSTELPTAGGVAGLSAI